MYLGILKRDLKRKKTMNTILLIFMILSVTLVASSVNTMMSVASAADKFLDISGAKDFFVATLGTKAGAETEKKLLELDTVRSVKREDIFYVNENAISKDGRMLEITSSGFLNSVDDIGIKIFDQDKKELTQVNEGEIYLKGSLMDKEHLSIGDRIQLTIGDAIRDFTIRGTIKDALFGSDMMGSPRFIISRQDFDHFLQNSTDERYEMLHGSILNVETDDIKAVENVVSGVDGVAFTGSRDIIKMSYIMDMIIVGVFLIVSVCLLIISVVLLRFTIGFTISEEYREIGIMKAIGIKNGKIRTLYMIKYLAMAIVGAFIGFLASIPFGNMMMEQSAKNFITGETTTCLINLACAAVVVLIIALFCRLSTRKVKHFTPVDAIRNGESGKRYKKKGLLRLSKSRTKPVFFMAVNNVLSGFRHYAVMMVMFVIGILLITIILNTMSTLRSPKLLAWFSTAECDATLEDKASAEKYNRPDGQQIRTEYLQEMERTLAENNIPARCFGEAIFKYSVQHGENKTVSLAFIGTGTTTDQYAYLEGTPPVNVDEIAMSYVTAEKINVRIGDKVVIKTGGEHEEFIVTAIYQSMNNMGEGVRFNEKLPMDFSKALGYFSYQIKFTDNPSSSEMDARFQKIKQLYPDYTFRTAGEYIDHSIGGIAGALNDTKSFIIIMVMLINILVVVLMEKSFLVKERGEIALLKALGFKNRSLIAWQAIRVGLLMLASIIIAVLLTEPCSQLAVGGIFKMMGAKHIVFDTNVLEAFVLYPLAVFAVTVLAAVLCSLSIRSIPSHEVQKIE